MKQVIIVFLIFIVSCQENDKLEILPDYDEEYLISSEVDSKVEILGDEEVQVSKILELVSKNYKLTDSVGYYFFRSKVYVNEIGKAEKIFFKRKFLKKYASKGRINYSFSTLIPELSQFISTQEFSPAIKNGKSVKSQFNWDGSFRVTADKGAEVFLLGLNMSSLKQLSNINVKNYNVKVEEMPSPIGGMKAIQEKVRYPEIAKRAGIQGRVFVKAFIDENGDVVATEVLKGIGAGLDEAAVEAIADVKFNPGREKGKAVKVQVTIPIMFKLN